MILILLAISFGLRQTRALEINDFYWNLYPNQVIASVGAQGLTT